MDLHYFTLQRQVEQLRREFSGARFAASYTRQKNEQVLLLEPPDGPQQELILSADPRYPFVLPGEVRKRSRNTVDVLPDLVGCRVERIELPPGERVIFFHLPDKLRLALQLFRNHANFFLLDGQDIILDSFKRPLRHRGKPFGLKPTSRRDMMGMGAEELLEFLQSLPAMPVEVLLRREFLYFDRQVAREICRRLELPTDFSSARLTASQCQQLLLVWEKFIAACRENPPRVYLQEDRPLHFTLTAFHSLEGLPYREFSTVEEGLVFFLFRRARMEQLQEKKETLTRLLERRIEQAQQALQQLQRLPDESTRRKEYQRRGELLLAQLNKVRNGADRVKLVDYFDPAQSPVELKLDPRLSPAENAERFFRRARESAQRVKAAREREQFLQKQSNDLQQLVAGLSEENDAKKLARLERRLLELRILQPVEEQLQEVYHPYKQHFVGRWEIWVGKSARANDEMTFRHAHKEDFWFHAQGVSGSHVIVRNPRRLQSLPPDVSEHAARLAAEHSKARHSNYVPVWVTRVKYVRKPRGSAPGAVVPERVKTLFVEPSGR